MWSLDEIGVMTVEKNLGTAEQTKHWNIRCILITENHIIGSVTNSNDKCKVECPNNSKQYIELVK